jgi:hypothetical protein
VESENTFKKRSGLLKAGIAAVGVLLAYSASADCINYICDDVKITMLYTEANGDTYVKVSGNMANLNCSLTSNTYITLSASSLRYKEIYAGLLAYQLADRPVGIRINEQSTGCTVRYIYAAN